MFAPRDLAKTLEQLLPGEARPHYVVAFSGGVDSTALLHALAALKEKNAALQVRALHVNHHLQPQADAWAAHAVQIAARLAVPLQSLDVEVRARKGESIEAVARARRYALLAANLEPGEVLLTAHHRDDQLETFLLQLLRGAGVAGLAAMPARMPFAGGWHMRPLLDVTRVALEDYLARAGLTWVEDTSNADARFDRNFLRAAVVPVLRERWPGVAANVARSAAHMAEARELLDEIAATDLADSRGGSTLQCAALRALAPPHARNAIRYWLREQGFSLPSTTRLDEIVHAVLHARPDATPVVRWPGVEVRRYRDRLYAIKPLPKAGLEAITWDWKSSPQVELGAGLGTLRLSNAEGAGLRLHDLPCPLRVQWRMPGAKIVTQPRRPGRTLRYLYQDAGVVPWMRARMPLLVSGNRLVAVATLCAAVQYQARLSEPGWLLEWNDHPSAY